MTSSGEPEFGLRLFEEAASGKSSMNGDSALLYAYGIYLSNGGTPSGFLDMTPDDIQIMFTAHVGSQRRLAKGIVKALIEATSKNGE